MSIRFIYIVSRTRISLIKQCDYWVNIIYRMNALCKKDKRITKNSLYLLRKIKICLYLHVTQLNTVTNVYCVKWMYSLKHSVCFCLHAIHLETLHIRSNTWYPRFVEKANGPCQSPSLLDQEDRELWVRDCHKSWSSIWVHIVCIHGGF